MSTRNRIKELRKEKGLSQKEFAKAFNEFSKDNENIKSISYATVSRWENGENEPKLETWIKLADFFDVPVSYLQGLSDHNYNNSTENTRSFLERNPNFAPLPKGTTLDDVDFSKGIQLVSANDVNLQMRDSTLKQFQKLASIFLSKNDANNWTELREDQRKKLIKIVNSVDDKGIDEIVHYVAMTFYMLLGSDNNKKKVLKKVLDDFHLKYVANDDDAPF